MKLKYILSAVLALSATASYATIGTMRSKAVTDLAQYTAPRTTPAAPEISFLHDGKSYAEKSDDGKKLVIKDIMSGKQTGTLFDITHTRETEIPDFEGFIISPDASKVIVWRDSHNVYRRSTTAQYYVYEVRSRILKPLSSRYRRQSVPLFSPDSRMVAFVAEGNIIAAKLDYGTEVDVTTDGKPGSIFNGVTDWTYEEEFGTTALMAWAPDNLTLCYVRTDESQVHSYSLPTYWSACSPDDNLKYYPGTLSYKYPVAGETNSAVTVHSYDVETRKTKQIELPQGAGYYIPRLDFGPEPTMLLISTLNRDQNRFELFSANPRSTVTRSIYVDESNTWIPEMVYSTLYLGIDSFTIASDASGFTRYSKYSYAGAKIADISLPDADATQYYGSDAQGNHYFQAAAPSPKDRTIYRLDKKGNYTPVSPDSGTSDATFTSTMSVMLLKHSSVGHVPVYSLCNNDGKEIRTVEDNNTLAAAATSLCASKEFIEIPGADGKGIPAYIVKPHDFNPAEKYPVIFSQYSGPGSQQVLDRWTLDWEDYFASQGYIILCADGRGTGGRGTDYRTAVYRNLGYYETIDQLTAARYAASLPYVDPDKIGIYGWSYGGYETLMCASADDCPFAAATAIAPVTDWRLYDTVYTERFMLTPQQNEKGYNNASAQARALHLACPLLMMYGTADDNVHPENTLQYVSILQNAGILCDMFVFPQKNHSINGCNARAVVYARMLAFFNSHLK